MPVERHEAIGQRGEACIIILRRTTLPNGESSSGYFLASGERLVQSEEPGQFGTLDGRRTFKLRHVSKPPTGADVGDPPLNDAQGN